MSGLLWCASIRSRAEYDAYAEHVNLYGSTRCQIEDEIAPPAGETSWLDGECAVCDRQTRFLIDYNYSAASPDGRIRPNYRERLVCEHCHLNARLRGTLHFMRDQAKAVPDARIFIAEQVTPFFKELTDRFTRVTGSEFLRDGTAPGRTNAAGIRHEDATALTFADGSLDLILSFEVLEHVPDYLTALREAYRCLAPGGRFIFTAPFAPACHEHLERARLVDGEIEHILPPEYHGDPVSEDGALCFRYYGWGLLDELREIGFRDAHNFFYWSRKLGYIGGAPSILMATK